jgi:hypothetical protein
MERQPHQGVLHETLGLAFLKPSKELVGDEVLSRREVDDVKQGVLPTEAPGNYVMTFHARLPRTTDGASHERVVPFFVAGHRASYVMCRSHAAPKSRL